MFKRIWIVALILIPISTSFVFGAQTATLQASPLTTTASHIVVEPVPESSLADGLVERATGTWPWYLTRASGLVAAIALVILMLSGVGLVTGHTFVILEPITAWASHRALGITFGLAVLAHLIGLYFDRFIPFDLQTLFIPFVSGYKEITIFGFSVGSLYIALGVLSMYLVAAIVITSLIWMDKKPKLWKITHLLSYLAMVFVFIHALYLGTDLAGGVLRWIWLITGLILFYALLARLWRARTT